MQPRRRVGGDVRDVRRRRGQPGVDRRAVDGPARAARCSAAATTRPTSSGPSPRRTSAGLATFNLDLIYGSVGESLDDWRVTLERALALEPPHVSAYALTVEPGTPLADDPAPPSRRRRAGRRVRARRRAADRGRAGQLRGVELGPTRPRVPPQPPVLAPAGLPRVRVRGPLAPRRTAVVEPAHAGALHRPRCARAGRPKPPARCSTPRPVGSRASSCRCAPRPGVPVDALDGDALPGVVERVGDRWVLTRRGRLMANDVAVRLR